MKQREPLDMTDIVNKLDKAGLVNKQPGRFFGDFIISKHGHLLSAPELESWIASLHMSSPHRDNPCGDDVIHRWNFQFCEERNVR